MKRLIKNKQIIFMILLILGLYVFTVVFPVSIYGPTFLQNSKLYRYENLSLYIEKFQQQEGRLPTSFEEIDLKFKDELKGVFSSYTKEYNINGLIIDCTDAEITFVIEAVWKGKDDDNLVWARTKSGQVIRFPKDLLDLKER